MKTKTKALPQKLLTDTTDEEYRYVFDTNVLGTIRLTRLLSDELRENHGAVVNISSMWGVAGASCETLYSASKASIIGFTKALAKELAPSGITVNCVSPGVIDTDMNSALSPDALASLAADTPLGRIGTPDDVAAAVAFFASDDASFITGQVLGVNGGYVI